MANKPDGFKFPLPETIKVGKFEFSKIQIIIIFIGLMLLAVLLGFGMKALFSGSKNKDVKANTFVQDNITFNCRTDEVIQRGDVVIFNRDNALDGYLIKRVIAVAGETVDIDDNGIVYVNGERYQTDKVYYKKDITMPLTVPEGELFVLGDNGDESADSRRSYVANVKVDEVTGIAQK